MAERPIKVGVIGLGFMGATHIRAFQAAANDGLCELVAVSDPNQSRRSGGSIGGGNIGPERQEILFDPTRVCGFANAQDLLNFKDVDLVSICTPTDTHVDLAIAALEAGKHVLLEKPVSLESSQVLRLARHTHAARSLCMPAMCMRFWPGWTLLAEAIGDQRYGKLRALTLTRLGSGPTWSRDFYANVARSGGALVDLHIHDTDFVVWTLGVPDRVRSSGGPMHVCTLYDYERLPGVSVSAEGSWSMAPAFGFKMLYRAAFEHATVEFDLSRAQSVAIHHEGETIHPQVPAGTGYDGQVRHFLDAIARGSRDLRATVASAADVARVLEAESRSAATQSSITV